MASIPAMDLKSYEPAVFSGQFGEVAKSNIPALE